MLVGKRGVTMSVFEDVRLMQSLRNVIEGKFQPPMELAFVAGIAIDMYSDSVTLSECV